MGEDRALAGSGGRRWRWVTVACGLIAAGLLFWFFRRPLAGGLENATSWLNARLEGFIGWVEGLGAIGPLVFIAGYALMTVALVPGSLLTLGAGTVFGIGAGLCYSLAGASLGAAAAFLASRYFARSFVARWVAGSPRFAAVDRAVGKHGLKICVLLRLSPIFPFVALNYVLGLTKVRFLHYNIASLAMLPGTLLYVYYGSLAKNLTELAADDSEPESWPAFVLRIFGLVAMVVFTIIVTRLARRELKQEIADADPAEHVEERAARERVR